MGTVTKLAEVRGDPIMIPVLDCVHGSLQCPVEQPPVIEPRWLRVALRDVSRLKYCHYDCIMLIRFTRTGQTALVVGRTMREMQNFTDLHHCEVFETAFVTGGWT